MGLAQKELAYEVNSSTADISRLENGVRIPKVEKLEKIANALGEEINELFDQSGPRPLRSERFLVRAAVERRLFKLDLADLRSVLRVVEELAKVRRRRR